MSPDCCRRPSFRRLEDRLADVGSVEPDPMDPCSPITVHAADGAALTVSPHGGQLLGWRTAAEPSRDRLWLSPSARCGPGEAIRGGVPVVFPQFSDRGPLPKHGVARDRVWSLEAQDDGSTGVLATLTDSETTRAIWPHAFTLGLRMTAEASRLALQLSVRNDGRESFSFTVALHTYLAAPRGSAVLGLDGALAEDNAAGGAEVTVAGIALDALAERDIAVRDLPGAVAVSLPDGGRITLTRTGFPDLVVWNPGPAHALSDVPAGQAEFVCLEPAALTPIHLCSTQTWQATAVYEII